MTRRASLPKGLLVVVALAVVRPALAAAERRLWASFALGPAAGVVPASFETEVFGLRVAADYEGPTQLKLVQALGYQLLAARRGPAVALELQESVGNRHVLLQIVPRLAWSFALPIKSLRLHVTPSVGVGYVHFSRQAAGGQSGSGDGLTAQLAVEGRLTLRERYFVSLRPIALDLQSIELTSGQVRAWGTFLRYDLLLGAGMDF